MNQSVDTDPKRRRHPCEDHTSLERAIQVLMDSRREGESISTPASSCHLYDGYDKVAKCMQPSLKYYSHQHTHTHTHTKRKKEREKERMKERGMRYDKRVEKSWPVCEHDVYCYRLWRLLKSVAMNLHPIHYSLPPETPFIYIYIYIYFLLI